jgi:hypothetical protein
MKQIKNRTMVVSVSLVISYLLVMVILVGCISGRTNIKYGPNGPPAGSKTLKQIKVGETSKAWLISALGEPSSESKTPEGTEVLKYHYVKEVDSSFEISPFLDFDDEKEEHITLYFEIKDGIVTRFWKDK